MALTQIFYKKSCDHRSPASRDRPIEWLLSVDDATRTVDEPQYSTCMALFTMASEDNVRYSSVTILVAVQYAHGNQRRTRSILHSTVGGQAHQPCGSPNRDLFDHGLNQPISLKSWAWTMVTCTRLPTYSRLVLVFVLGNKLNSNSHLSTLFTAVTVCKQLVCVTPCTLFTAITLISQMILPENQCNLC